ncbi:60S ribosomal protein L25 [Malassezia sp. CBS 17886]|nr:60S ribosomal protein L25 [Malassezia sp. CBS 17886]
MASRAPPFAMPGFIWDPERNRFFKAGAPLAAATPPATRSDTPRKSRETDQRRAVAQDSLRAATAPTAIRTGLRATASTSENYRRGIVRATIPALKQCSMRSLAAELRAGQKILDLLRYPRGVYGALHGLPFAVVATDDDVLITQGNILDAPSTMLSGDNFHRLSMFVHPHDAPIVTEVTVTGRWMLHVRSTSGSARQCAAELQDPSRRPERDLRCLTVHEGAADDGPMRGWTCGPVVAFGIGQHVEVARLWTQADGGEAAAYVWALCTIPFTSDVMTVAVAGQQSPPASVRLLVGTRSGKVALCVFREAGPTSRAPSLELVEEPEAFALAPRAAVCAILTVGATEFVASYTNGEVRIYRDTFPTRQLVLGDHTRLFEGPLREYVGHRNRYMQDLVRGATHSRADGQGICLIPEYRLLVCAGDDARIRIWSLDSEDPVNAPCVANQLAPNDIGASLQETAFAQPVTALAWWPAPWVATEACTDTTPTEKKSMPTKKANVARKVVQKGSSGQQRVRKVRTSPSFHRPKTLRLPRNPKYPRKSAPHAPRADAAKILLFPLNTESAMKKIEEVNTLVFIVDRTANKRQIKLALKHVYDVDADQVNTLIRPDGKKKAFIRLTADQDALDVSNRIGFI